MLDGLRTALTRALLLRNELHRTRYSADFESLQDSFRQLVRGSRGDQLKTAAGMALAMEQQGRAALKTALHAALEGDGSGSRQQLADLARMVRSFGALQLASNLDDLSDQLEQSEERMATAAVLARAELDRVIFTLREQVLHH